MNSFKKRFAFAVVAASAFAIAGLTAAQPAAASGDPTKGWNGLTPIESVELRDIRELI